MATYNNKYNKGIYIIIIICHLTFCLVLIVLFILKNSLKLSRRTFTQIIQQQYDIFKGVQLILQYAFQYFPNKNHESIIFSYLPLLSDRFFYFCFFTLEPINLGTNINNIPVRSVTRSFSPFNPKLSIQKQVTQKKKKKKVNILTYIKVSAFYSVSNCQWQPHKSLILKAFKKFNPLVFLSTENSFIAYQFIVY